MDEYNGGGGSVVENSLVKKIKTAPLQFAKELLTSKAIITDFWEYFAEVSTNITASSKQTVKLLFVLKDKIK